MSPSQWRKDRRLSQRDAAILAGITGKNPARTWNRWELGERQPPMRVVAKIEDESDGRVSARAWADLREAFMTRLTSPAAVSSE
jgi:transcriptional regulator with XRE-family HTH domain